MDLIRINSVFQPVLVLFFFPVQLIMVVPGKTHYLQLRGVEMVILESPCSSSVGTVKREALGRPEPLWSLRPGLA